MIFTSQQNIRSAITVKNHGADTFVPLEMTVPKFRGEEHVRWDGRARFKGQVMAPACTLAMEAAWREIDMGTTPLRDLLPVQRINSCYGYTTVILQVQESRSTR
ncbi:nuclease PIN [Escherichia coli]|nr:nuclease PIN [Escherichia coli]KLG68717.1 nuclease PIN [Escherichia coli]KLG72620.1 nuclease PIN [Escherichia coli]KOA32063.1 nuclease PIN [Escherichia coli]